MIFALIELAIFIALLVLIGWFIRPKK